MNSPVETLKPERQRDFAARYQRKRQAKAWFASSPTRSRILKQRSRNNPGKYEHDAQASEPANRPNHEFRLNASINAQLQNAQASEPANPPSHGLGLNADEDVQLKNSRVALVCLGGTTKIVPARLGSDQRDVRASLVRRLRWLAVFALPIYGMLLQWALIASTNCCAALQPENVFLVVNARSWSSVTIANHFAALAGHTRK